MPDRYPIWSMVNWALNNPKVIRPGLSLLHELLTNYRRHGVMPVTRSAEEMMRNGVVAEAGRAAVKSVSLGAQLCPDKPDAV